MRVALYGESAFAYYLVAGDAPSAVAPPSVLDKSCYPTQATLDYVRERMPYLTRPVHCLVPKWERCTDVYKRQHLDEAAVGVPSEARVVGLLDEAVDGLVVKAEVQHLSLIHIYNSIMHESANMKDMT